MNLKIGSFIPVQIVYVWAMVLMGIVIYSIAWFAVAPVTLTVMDTLTEHITVSNDVYNLVELIKQVILWHPILSIFGWLLWGYLNSMRRDIATWRV